MQNEIMQLSSKKNMTYKLLIICLLPLICWQNANGTSSNFVQESTSEDKYSCVPINVKMQSSLGITLELTLDNYGAYCKDGELYDGNGKKILLKTRSCDCFPNSGLLLTTNYDTKINYKFLIMKWLNKKHEDEINDIVNHKYVRVPRLYEEDYTIIYINDGPCNCL
jgi:hypothetical protein